MGSLSQSKLSNVGSSSTVSSGLNENPVIQEMTEKLNSQAEQINSQAQELGDVRRQMSEMRFLIE